MALWVDCQDYLVLFDIWLILVITNLNLAYIWPMQFLIALSAGYQKRKKERVNNGAGVCSPILRSWGTSLCNEPLATL